VEIFHSLAVRATKNKGEIMSHLLIDKSFKYKIPTQNESLHRDYSYDDKRGYWLNKNSGHPLMHEDNQYKPRTKKEDVETGEDRKGE